MQAGSTLLVLLLSFFLITPGRNTVKTVTVAHDIPEFLNGKVKQLIEIRPGANAAGTPQLCPTDTTDFDANGNSLQTRLGDGSHVCVIYNYTNRYNIDNKKVEMIRTGGGPQTIFAYGDEDMILGAKKESMRMLYDYNSNNNVTGLSVFHGTLHSFFKKKFKYNSDKQLIETDTYYKDPKMVERTLYKYEQFDDKKNWTKRTVTYKNDAGNVIKEEIVERKITYFTR